MDYHGANKEHIFRYVTNERRDKTPKEHRPSGAGFHVFVFFVAFPLCVFQYAQEKAPQIQTPVISAKCKDYFVTVPK